MSSLAGALITLGSGRLMLRKATVTVDSPLTVRLEGAEVTATGCLESYVPVAGQVVACLVDGSSLLVLGRIM